MYICFGNSGSRSHLHGQSKGSLQLTPIDRSRADHASCEAVSNSPPIRSGSRGACAPPNPPYGTVFIQQLAVLLQDGHRHPRQYSLVGGCRLPTITRAACHAVRFPVVTRRRATTGYSWRERSVSRDSSAIHSMTARIGLLSDRAGQLASSLASLSPIPLVVLCNEGCIFTGT